MKRSKQFPSKDNTIFSERIKKQGEKVQNCAKEVALLEQKLQMAKDMMAKEGGILADLISTENNDSPLHTDVEDILEETIPSIQVAIPKKSSRVISLKEKVKPPAQTSPITTTPSRQPSSMSYPRQVESIATLPQHGIICSNMKSAKFGEINSFYQVAHDLKPRAIVFNPRRHHVFATSGLDGNLRFWEYQDKQLKDLGSLGPNVLRNSRFPTAIAWDNDGNKCAALFPLPSEKTTEDKKESPPKSQSRDSQLITLETSNIPHVSATFLQDRPHTKDPSALSFLTSSKIVTVGNDKKVVLWSINYEKHTADTEILNIRHTASINTVCVDRNSIIYTGGSDRKLCSFSSQTNQDINEWRMEGKICHLRLNPNHDKLLLVGLLSKQKQLHIFDTRVQNSVLSLSYTVQYTEQSPSQYILPSWSSNGTLVASGSIDPVLHIWDIRYNQIEMPTKSWPVHKKRVLRAEFHPSIHNCILTLSSDRQIGCHNIEREDK